MRSAMLGLALLGAAATDQDRHPWGRCGTLGTGAGCGVQSAMVRARSRALTLST